MSQYPPKPYKRFEGNINVKVDLSNYPAKTDLKSLYLLQNLLHFYQFHH